MEKITKKIDDLAGIMSEVLEELKKLNKREDKKLGIGPTMHDQSAANAPRSMGVK